MAAATASASIAILLWKTTDGTGDETNAEEDDGRLPGGQGQLHHAGPARRGRTATEPLRTGRQEGALDRRAARAQGLPDQGSGGGPAQGRLQRAAGSVRRDRPAAQVRQSRTGRGLARDSASGVEQRQARLADRPGDGRPRAPATQPDPRRAARPGQDRGALCRLRRGLQRAGVPARPVHLCGMRGCADRGQGSGGGPQAALGSGHQEDRQAAAAAAPGRQVCRVRDREQARLRSARRPVPRGRPQEEPLDPGTHLRSRAHAQPELQEEAARPGQDGLQAGSPPHPADHHAGQVEVLLLPGDRAHPRRDAA